MSLTNITQIHSNRTNQLHPNGQRDGKQERAEAALPAAAATAAGCQTASTPAAATTNGSTTTTSASTIPATYNGPPNAELVQC